MYIKSTKIENIRCFEKLSLEFQSCRDGSNPLLNWNVILGNNGDGKSTLLQSIAACLMDTTTAQSLWKPEDRDVVRSGKDYGELQAVIGREEGIDRQEGRPIDQNEWRINYLVIGEGKEIQVPGLDSMKSFSKSTILEPSFDTRLYFGDDFEKLINDVEYLKRNAFSKKERYGWVSCGYGPFRRVYGFSTDSAMAKDELKRRFLTLFDEGASLYDCESWLKELDRKASKENKGSSKRQTLNRVKELLKSLLPGLDEISIEDEVRFKRGKEFFNLNELSDGYRSMFALAVDLMRWLELLRKDKSQEINQTPGVVLIDEVDAHLHPRWQRQIGFWLTDLFPNIQFIVTSHSPFVAMAAGEGALTILERNEDGLVIANQDVPFARGWAVDKVLSELLGMDSLRDPETEQMLEEYDKLKIISLQHPLDMDEARKFDDLRNNLEKRLKDSDKPLDERELDEDLKYFAALAKKKG